MLLKLKIGVKKRGLLRFLVVRPRSKQAMVYLLVKPKIYVSRRKQGCFAKVEVKGAIFKVMVEGSRVVNSGK
jgi:hypothetical protein